MTKLDGKTPDLAAENIEQLRQIFPDVFEEGKIDFDKLKQVLGEYVDDEKERYNFTWNGKSKALRLAQTPTTGTLRPCPEERESKNWNNTQNLYIEGDNLEVLKLLQKSYHGKIKMIYIDPPYNTGGDFVYPDDFSDSIENYKRITGQIDTEGNVLSTNTEANGRFHTDWLNMIYPRLRLARNLLKANGVLFVSIDDREIDNIKKICSEIFGEENFVGIFCRKTKSGGGSASGSCAVEHDYVLAYAKMIGGINPLFEKFNDGYLDRYKECDEKGPYFWDTMERSSTKTRPYIIIAPDGSKLTGKWFRSEETFKNDLKTGEVRFLKKDDGWSVQFKQRLADGKKLRTILDESNLTDKKYRSLSEELENIVQCTIGHPPKPLTLMNKLVNSVCRQSENDIALDFFSGSATTAHAVMQLNAEDGGNRKFIMVQLPEPCADGTEAAKAGYKNICEIGKERIRRAGEKIKAEIEEQNDQLKIGEKPKKVPDIGFKVFKLDSSNLKQWHPDYDDLETTLFDSISNYVEGRSELDVVYEIMLKMGMELTWPLETHTIGGKNVYEIGMGALMICLDDQITTEVAEGMAALYKELAPETWRVVFKDNGFADDSAKVNIKEILKTAGLEEDAFTTV